jgi:hypothetical protein
MSTAGQHTRRLYRRILVSGSPQWSDRTIIRVALAQVWHPETVLVVGPSDQGAESLCQQCWTAWHGRVELRHGDGAPADLWLVFLSGAAPESDVGVPEPPETGAPVVTYREPVAPRPDSPALVLTLAPTVEPEAKVEPQPEGRPEAVCASITVLERMNRAGIGSDRARAHLLAGRVRVDGVVVDDLDMPVEIGARIVLR